METHMMQGGMGMDPKKKALEELMAHLNLKDDQDLGAAMKPKGAAIEAVKVQGLGDAEPDAEESPGVKPGEDDAGGGAKLSEEEIMELIEALQSKLGASA